MNKRSDYEILRFARWIIYDALTAATHIASRAADCLEGTDNYEAFAKVRDAIQTFREYSPEMKAIKDVMYAARKELGQ